MIFEVYKFENICFNCFKICGLGYFFEIIVLFIFYGNFLNLYLIIYIIVLKSVYFSIFFIFNVKKCELYLQWLYSQKDNVWVYFKCQYFFYLVLEFKV